MTARTHHYVAEAAAVPWPAGAPCAACGLPRAHAAHVVDPVPDEVREIDARVLGEQLEAADG